MSEASRSKRYDKLKLKSLRYLINEENKGQVPYFDKLANMEETKIDYKSLYYRSGNRNREPSNFEKFGTMAELFQEIKFEKIALEDTKLKLAEFNHELNLLRNTTARKQIYKDKKGEVLKSAESLLKGQRLIYNGFMDNIFSRGEEFSTPKEVTPRDEIPDFGTEEMFNDEETEGHRLKILTPKQILSRLPISLTQLEAGNNSEKLKNEIRQLLYSLYR